MKTSNLQLRGVGKQIEKYLARLDIFSIQDLLLHLPIRYQDRTQVTPLRNLIPGMEALIVGYIREVSYPAGGKTKILVQVVDATGKLTLRFFHALPYQKEMLKAGMLIRCFSEVRSGSRGLEMMHPEFKVFPAGQTIPEDEQLTPIYPATEGLTQHTLRKITDHALELLDQKQIFSELLPKNILNDWPTLQAALNFVHRPPRDTAMVQLMENTTHAQQRLAFEELLAHRISLLNLKQLFQARHSVILNKSHLADTILSQLPFALTSAQQRVMGEVKQDLLKPQPMLRLVQGDVGSGKTIIALMAMLQAVSNGYQAALMAPTELLAEQHHKNFQQWLKELDIPIAYVSGAVKGKARTKALAAIASGEAQIILGTHALYQQGIEFAKLALVVMDEQHRFGVQQRACFHDKGKQGDLFPHQLVMTATPIPRTLAMSFYAELDCSVIDELPPGREAISTSVIANTKRDEVIRRVFDACLSGRQAYWVCPLIDASETLSYQAATSIVEELRAKLSHLKIDLIHGRMSAQEKAIAMAAFQQGETQLLVATTVIEVGVDVPNASLMIIENAERLGLSQLHQLRGRVGRGKVASHCVLLYQSPLSALARERLQVIRESTDGFKIAQRDLELRGPGEVLGTKQTGELSFRIADLLRDKSLLSRVQEGADLIIKQYPELIEPLTKRWLSHREEYAKV